MFINWIKRLFNYYVFGIDTKQLIDMINDQAINITDQLRKDLTQSVANKDANRFVEQLDQASESAKERLMVAVIPNGSVAAPVVAAPVVHIPEPAVAMTVVPVPVSESDGKMFEYRGFMIANDLYKTRIDTFLDWIPKHRPELIDGYNDQTIPSSVEQIEARINQLYSLEDMWSHYLKREYDDSVVEWALELRSLIVALVRGQLSNIEAIHGKRNRSIYVHNEILRCELQYSKLFSELILGPNGEKFLKCMLHKMLEFVHQDGVSACLLVLAHYRPDLVCSEVYPIINQNGPLYEDCKLLEHNPLYSQLYQQYKQFL